MTRQHVQKPETHSGLRISQRGDALEQQADRTADAVMSGGARPSWSLPGRSSSQPAPQSGGRPLDSTTRSFMEPRFGHDFSRVRIHTDAEASRSARDVRAQAYTVGDHITFGEGRFAPQTAAGRKLLAHELAHVVQQEHAPARGMLQRVPIIEDLPRPGAPCIDTPDCRKPIPGSSWDFATHPAEQSLESAEEDLEKKRQAEAKKHPGKKQEKKGEHVEVLVTDVEILESGSPGPAPFFKKVVNSQDKTLLKGVYDVFVNPAITRAGGQTTHCELASPKPKDPNARCMELPPHVEDEAKSFDSGDKTVGGRPRDQWLTDTLGTARHEQAHGEYLNAPPVPEGPPVPAKVFGSDQQIFRFELGEMNSILSEFPIHYRRQQGTPEARDKAVREWLIGYINNKQEGLAGIVKKLYCVASCGDVHDGAKKVFESQSRNWTEAERQLFLSVVGDPANGVAWPF